MSKTEETERTVKDRNKRQFTVELRDYAGTDRGKVLECLKKDGLGKEAAVWQLVLAWYLPFTLAPDDPRMGLIASQCVGLLEGRIAAILRYANLLPPTATVLSQPTSLPAAAFPENGRPSNALPDGDLAEESEETDEDWEWQQRKQERQALDRALLGI